MHAADPKRRAVSCLSPLLAVLFAAATAELAQAERAAPPHAAPYELACGEADGTLFPHPRLEVACASQSPPCTRSEAAGLGLWLPRPRSLDAADLPPRPPRSAAQVGERFARWTLWHSTSSSLP